MRILHLAKAYPPETGGIETYSEQVAMAYARAGHRVSVVTAHPGPAGVERRGEVSVLNVGQGPQPLVFARMLRALWAMRSEPFDFVHATSWRVALPALALRRAPPLVVTVHGREVFVVPRPLRPLLRHVTRRAQVMPTVSQAILDRFQASMPFPLTGAFPDWNGISFEAESRDLTPKPAGRVEVFCLCRLIERKNVSGAIRAVAALLRRGADLRFRIAGDGPEREKLASLIEAEGMGAHIRLLGWVSDAEAIALYRDSHVFLHPQIAIGAGDLEGFGLSIADAMSFGAVPIAGASGGPLDFVRPNETGCLVNGENVAEIEAALAGLIGDRAQLEALGRAAWDFAHSRLTWSSHAEAILQRAQALLPEFRSAPA